MRYRHLLAGLCLAVLVTAAAAGPAAADIVITVDEHGNGTLVNPTTGTFILPASMSPDPGPGGLAAALTYNLLGPPGLVIGDIILLEPGSPGLLSDVLRFNPNGTLVFYSDNLDGADAPADTGFPTAFYANVRVFTEVGPEGANGFTYTPGPNDPGFVAGAAFPVTYVFRSDSAAIPEPGTFVLGCVAMSSVGFVGWRRRHRAKLAA